MGNWTITIRGVGFHNLQSKAPYEANNMAEKFVADLRAAGQHIDEATFTSNQPPHVLGNESMPEVTIHTPVAKASSVVGALLFAVAFATVLLWPVAAFAQDAGLPVLEAPISYAAPMWQALVGLIGTALTLLLGVLVVFFNGLAKRSAAGAVASKLFMVVQSAVLHAEAELRPQFQKALADGTLSAEEGAALKAAVMKLVKESAASMLPDLAKQFGDGAVATMLSGMIERAVSGLKAPGGAPAPNP